MKLVSEVSIDIDANRKVWLVASAEGVDVDEVEEVAANLAGVTVDQATKAYALVRPSLEGKPAGPKMPPTFQED